MKKKTGKEASIRGFKNDHLLFAVMKSKYGLFQALYTQSNTITTRESTSPEENAGEDEEDIPLEEACVVCQVSLRNFSDTNIVVF